MNIIPRPEHPDPQFERVNWLNLNGEWDFEFDFGNSKYESDILNKKDWEQKINVPFCPESKLSGIEHTDFIPAVWYRKTVNITKEQLSGRVLLHFGAVDQIAYVYLNGVFVGKTDNMLIPHRLPCKRFPWCYQAFCRNHHSFRSLFRQLLC